jgi:hypothetical protein
MYCFGVHIIDFARAVINRQASDIWGNNHPNQRQCPDQYRLYVNDRFPLLNGQQGPFLISTPSSASVIEQPLVDAVAEDKNRCMYSCSWSFVARETAQ